MRGKKFIVATAVAASTVLVAGATPASAAVTALDIVSAERQARGAAVAVTVAYSCTSGEFGDLSVAVVQRGARQQNTAGSGSQQATCDGTTQQGTVLVIGNRPFKKGEAVVFASVFSCGELGCTGRNVSEVVTLG